MVQRVMAEARVRDLNGKVLYLQPIGDTHIPGHQYFREQFDRGKTFCPCCSVPVVYRHATESVAGSSFRGRRGYFALAPGKQHEAECDIVTRPRAERHLVPDRTKGYRIHINTRSYSETFNDEVGVYMRGKNGQVMIADPDLRDRERKVVNTASELVAFLRTADLGRIKDSKVIFRNKAVDWDDFFIFPEQKTKNARYAGLLDRMEALPKDEETFCAIILKVGRGTRVTYKDRTVRGMRQRIHRPDETITEYVVPQIAVQNMHNTYLTEGFTQPGDYLVMGVPALWSNDSPHQSDYYIRIPVNNPDAVMKVDLQDVLRARKEKGRGVSADVSATPAP